MLPAARPQHPRPPCGSQGHVAAGPKAARAAKGCRWPSGPAAAGTPPAASRHHHAGLSPGKRKSSAPRPCRWPPAAPSSGYTTPGTVLHTGTCSPWRSPSKTEATRAPRRPSIFPCAVAWHCPHLSLQDAAPQKFISCSLTCLCLAARRSTAGPTLAPGPVVAVAGTMLPSAAGTAPVLQLLPPPAAFVGLGLFLDNGTGSANPSRLLCMRRWCGAERDALSGCFRL